MSSRTPESRNTSERETTIEIGHVTFEIPSNQLNKASSLATEWNVCMTGREITNHYTPQRPHIQKVPLLLLEGEKGSRNRECYEPAVVSLGPYHYKQARLAQAEEYKLITLEEYCLSTMKSINSLYNKVFEVVHDARKSYIDGSTDAYSDEEFSRMMLRDGCFILFFIESLVTSAGNGLFLSFEYLGTLGSANVVRDILLMENQIPFVVLEVLMKLKFPDDKGEYILNAFFSSLNYGNVMIRDKKVLGDKQPPLHLLDLYRSYFISLTVSLEPPSTDPRDAYSPVTRSRSLASATELKSKWIFLRRTFKDDMAFHSHCCYGVFKLPYRVVASYTKAHYLNMLAYEMCQHKPNDLRVSTYIRVMKSLIAQDADVKELKNKNILAHTLCRDEQVVKMFDEINEVPAVNYFMFNHFLRGIEDHQNSKYKTWLGGLVSPWKVLGLLVAAALLFTSFLQIYFSAKTSTNPPPPPHA